MIQDPATTQLIVEIVQQYGLPGLIIAVGFKLYLKQQRRLAELEKQSLNSVQQHADRYAAALTENTKQHKEMISEYVLLVQSNISVINKLSTCIDSLKGAINRIENKS